MTYQEPEIVWPFLPNWAQSYQESWEFKTDIIVSRSGKEQRRALRNTPRKTVEYTSLITRTDFQKLNRHLDSKQTNIMAAPDLPRFSKITSALTTSGLTATVDVVKSWMVAGQIVVLRSSNKLDFRKIESISGSTITFTYTGRENFVSGDKIHPALVVFLKDQVDVQRITNGVANASVSLEEAPGYFPLIDPPTIGFNAVLNSQAFGFTPGIIGSGGSLPSRWSQAGTAGLTYEVQGASTVNGVRMLRLRISGTPNSTSAQIRFESITQNPALLGQTWTAGIHFALISGSTTNISSTQIRVTERSNTGSSLTSSSKNLSLSDSVQRDSITRTLSNASTAYVSSDLWLSLTVGAAVDITILIGGASLEKSASLSEYYPTPPAAGGLPALFDGRELFLMRPNWAQPVDLSFAMTTETVDFGRGRVARYNPIAFTTRLLKATYLRRDETDAQRITGLFMRAKGRRGEFYMPTWEQDITPTSDLSGGAATITASGLDVFNTYAESTIFKALAVVTKDGAVYCRRVSTIVNVSGDSRITVDQPWDSDIPVSNISMICWLPLCRFASDQLTLEWLTQSVVQTQLAFQTLEWAAAE